MRQVVISEHQANCLIKSKNWVTLLANCQTVKRKVKDELILSLADNHQMKLCSSARCRNTFFTIHGVPFYIEIGLVFNIDVKINKITGAIACDNIVHIDSSVKASHSGLMTNTISVDVKLHNRMCSFEEYATNYLGNIGRIASISDLHFSITHLVNDAYLDTVGHYHCENAQSLFEINNYQFRKKMVA